MAGGKAGSGLATVYRYLMSIHMGVCSGPVDALLEIKIGEKSAWTGNMTSGGNILIDSLASRNLFGGLKKQGGVVGNVHFLPGHDTQVLPDILAARLNGLTGATCPGFRGITSLFFVGFEDPGDRGFYWTANSPFLQTVWIKVRRQPKGLSTDYDPTPDSAGVADANPASIIYECLTNTDWGMGAPSTVIDVTSFNTAAAALYTENLFLSMMWARSDTIENFIAEVLNHINGMLFTHPLTGLLTIKLLRDDYDHDTIPELNPDNATISNYKRKLYGETTDEIIVTYTDPVTEQASTVTVQDLANIQIQNGDVISDTRNYYGVRKPLLAVQLGQRDLRMMTLPLVACEAQVDRTQWGIAPGDVRTLVWPEHGIDSVVMRVMKVDYGKPTDAKIKLILAQDIFAVPFADFNNDGNHEDSQWVDGSEDPRAIDFSKVVTAPAYFMAQQFGDLNPDLLLDLEVVAMVFAAQNSLDTWYYDLCYQKVTPLGVTAWTDYGQKDLLSTATLAADLAQEVSSTVASLSGFVGAQAKVDDLVFIGTGTDDLCEVAMISAIDSMSGAYTLLRGLLDTTPLAWTAGTQVWIVTPNRRIIDKTLRANGEVVDYRVVTRTSKGLLDVTTAPTLAGTLNNRPHQPLRPAHVNVGGTTFGTFDATGLSTVAVTWANRNRLTETSQILAWDGASATPEAGQTTTVRLLDSTGAFITDIDGLTGTSYTLVLSAFGVHASGYVQLLSKRDGLVSLQGHKIHVINIEADYGAGYGLNYGG